MTEAERKTLGERGKEHVRQNYNFDSYVEEWDKTLQEIHEKNGSWNTRKNYKAWELLEV